ncbi:SulP family inorganic anion transporter [Aureivirga sp. CE67]|uniref:SulP family inorganic anion transporter n=1 Tax=Aureivirga sp. CE67 TaxID=1788983 RepID=UPI0018CAC95F|nr:SulP family inorganic anion transporter [Aureivirga sp. CE67]
MFSTFKSDLPASIVVFFVALPLCLGIALASGAPLFSGLISGIIGGILVGAISGSKIGVSGPAAGLAVIVLTAINSLGFENFLVAVVLAGAIQILFGVLKFGVIGYYFPSSVIKGMLTGIGIIIFKKQIPIFFGYKTYEELATIGDSFQTGAVIVGVVSLAILLLWSSVLSKKGKIFTIIQGPIVAVVVGILFFTYSQGSDSLNFLSSQLVEVPVPDSFDAFKNLFVTPNFAAIGNSEIWLTAFTMALVASLETLLCVEATDKLDPHKNVTPTNRELFAQGAGNILSGMIGGLPITQVIVRSSANIQSGGRSKMSAILHGFLLLISVVTIPVLLNKIPLSVLAAVLLIVGYKLAKPALFVSMYKLGWKQSLPFVVTVGGIVFADLLIGIGLGLAVGVLVVLLKSYQNSHFLHEENVSDNVMKMTLAEEVTFFNKGAILKELDRVPANTSLELDVRNTVYLDHDIIEILEDFAAKSANKNIKVKVISEKGIIDNPNCYTEVFKDTLKMV